MKIGILHVKISYEFVIDHIEFIDPKEVYEVWRSQGVRHVLCLSREGARIGDQRG